MEEFVIGKNEEIVMKLLHYFITEKGYTPIILHGAQNEIWLENLDSNYEVVRIVTDYIHNNEQLDFDFFKTKQILKRIKRKTFSFSLNTLNLFTNLGDNVKIDDYIHQNHIDSAKLENVNDLKKYDFIKDEFPTIMEDTNFKEDGFNLFLKITNDINKANESKAIQTEEIFKKKTPYVTYALILINVLCFISMYVLGNGSYDNRTLINFGAMVPSMVRLGDYYRLITSAFIHIGLIHLACNMYCLYVIGPQLESFYGKTRYLIIYLSSAIISGLFSMLFHLADGNVISAGASGAIFGLLGSLLYFGYHYRVYLGTVLKSQIIPLIILNLGLGFMLNGIDNAAHIGGLIGGTLISMVVGVKYKETRFEQINGFIITTIFVTFITYIAFKGI